jgi:alcohol dehydrogenase class IV
MGMSFEFATSARILFGNGCLSKAPDIARSFGNRALVVTGINRDLVNPFLNGLTRVGIGFEVFNIDREPTITDIETGLSMARHFSCNLVIGYGGGSAIDSAKAIAAMVNNSGDLSDYLEVIGKGKQLSEAPLPCIVIPTTSGTGAEVTKNAVIKSPEHKMKVSLRSPLMFPAVAIVDPELTWSMPPELTASTGIDALTHLLETFVSNKANKFTDMLCREGMRRISSSLKLAWSNETNSSAREDMSMASLLGGMALANGKLGAVHGIAGPLGGMYPISHGTVCATLLPAVMETNIRLLIEQGLNDRLERYNDVARILTGNNSSSALNGVEWIRELVTLMKIPPLSMFGINETDFPEIVSRSLSASSMKGNPVVLTDNDIMAIIKMAL